MTHGVSGALLPVVFDHPGGPGGGVVRVLTELPARPSLPEEVPALVKRLLDRVQPAEVSLAER